MKHVSGKRLLVSLAAFVFDYTAFAGRKGWRAVTLVLAGAMLEGFGLALIAPMLAILFETGRASGVLQPTAAALFARFGITTLFGRIVFLLGLFVAAMIIRAFVLLARDVAVAELRIGFVEYKRGMVAHALASASWASVVRLRHARVLQVMSSDTQQIGQAAFFFGDFTIAAAMLAVQCVLALLLSPLLASLSFVLLIASGLALLPMMRRSQNLGALTIAASQNLLHGTAQFLGGLKLAVSQNLQHSYLAEFHSTTCEQSAQQIGFIRQQTTSRLIIATAAAVVGAALVLVGLTLLHVAPAILLAVIVVVTRMSGPSAKIQKSAQMLANTLPAYEAVQSLMGDLEPEPVPAGMADFSAVAQDIRFDRVTFTYPLEAGETHGIFDMSLAIAPGTCLGIKGSSGAGKTTFADLLAGLYPPQSGRITIGDLPLQGPLLHHWRNTISYVAQDPFLFHDTIRRNLAWADLTADEKRLWQALDLVKAEDFIRKLPAGLDTPVGERGMLISGGERQRIALARAVLRRPELLILDEATNALDPETEAAILARLVALSPKPTIVVIAHRPDALAHCDRVLTIENGRLA